MERSSWFFGTGKTLRRSSAILILASSIFILPQLSFAAQYAPSNEALDAAEANFKARDYDKAIFSLNQLIGLNRTDPKAFMLRARANFKLNNYQLAIDDFNKVLEYSPNYFQAFMWRGTAHAKLGKDDLAIMDYEQAIRLNPRLAKRYFNPPSPRGEKPSQAVINRERFHLPGVMAEDLKSPANQDYEAAMKRVYPDGYSATAPKREGGANTETYASDADDANYMEEMAAGASESDKAARRSNGRRSADSSRGGSSRDTSGSNDAGNSKNSSKSNGGRSSREKSDATTGDADGNSAQAAGKQHKRKKDDRGVYQAEAADPSASTATNVEGSLDIGRSSDSLDPRKNRRAVTNIFDQDPDFGEFGAVPGSQPIKGDPETVIKRTTEALRQDKDNPEYHYLRARAYQKMQRANDAYKDYTQAIEINPQVTKYFIGRASLFYQLNKPLMVDADVKRAQAIDQELPHKIQFGGEPYPPSIKWMGDGPGGD